MRALRRQVEAYLGKRWTGGLMTAFDQLLLRGRNPVSRSI
jgi:putative transposase